jgi:ankyrin repeat protein
VIVKLLLEHGADPNARELMCQGSNALFTAAANNHLEVARLLLEAGANPEHWMDSSGTPIIIAAYRGHSEMMQLLYAYGATTEIQYYAANYRIDVIAEVLKLKPSLAADVLPYQWIKPWDKPELALDIMRLAIRYGATFEDETAYKLINTTLAYPNVARLLFEHGGNPSRPLAYATRGFHGATRDTVVFLVETCGADVNYRKGEDELTPLASAASNGQREIVEYLIAKGASVNPPNTPSWATPLYLAQKNGHAQTAALLREHGATE